MGDRVLGLCSMKKWEAQLVVKSKVTRGGQLVISSHDSGVVGHASIRVLVSCNRGRSESPGRLLQMNFTDLELEGICSHNAVPILSCPTLRQIFFKQGLSLDSLGRLRI